MPCYGPLTAYYGKKVNPSGKRPLVFDPRAAHDGLPIKLPCGRCIGCRLEKSRQWAVRCMHEAKMHNHSAFVTLTYRDDKIPPGGTLVKRDLQLFMKRLRKSYDRQIRFYACGEYGDTTQRPHYHLLLFNVLFDDRKRMATGKTGDPLYTSERLSRLWPDGHHWIGEVTFDSCAYVARYILKKVTGDAAAAHYEVVDQYGELHQRIPEFTVMSRRDGIGKGWFDQYHSEVYAYDSVITNGAEAKPPRFYDTKFELLDSYRMDEIKAARKLRALDPARQRDNTAARLRTRELVQQKKLEFWKKRVFL